MYLSDSHQQVVRGREGERSRRREITSVRHCTLHSFIYKADFDSSKLPYYRSSDSPPPSTNEYGVVAHRTKVELSQPKQYLNTLTIASTEPSDNAPPPAVMLHGYGAGLGFFFQNFAALGEWAASRKSTVYAVDWLGMGRSARVPFVVKSKRDDIDGRVKEAESFFVESLEDWRQRMGLEKMTLIGHSLGGYLSVAYTLRYPTRVSKLILLSPAGIPRDPNTTVPSREVTDSPDTSSADLAESASKKNVDSLRSEQKEAKQKESRTRRLITHLWEEGWSPFQLVRTMGVWAPMMVGKYSSRRFIGLGMEDTNAMHEYILNITLAKGSGEYCICE